MQNSDRMPFMHLVHYVVSGMIVTVDVFLGPRVYIPRWTDTWSFSASWCSQPTPDPSSVVRAYTCVSWIWVGRSQPRLPARRGCNEGGPCNGHHGSQKWHCRQDGVPAYAANSHCRRRVTGGHVCCRLQKWPCVGRESCFVISPMCINHGWHSKTLPHLPRR